MTHSLQNFIAFRQGSREIPLIAQAKRNRLFQRAFSTQTILNFSSKVKHNEPGRVK